MQINEKQNKKDAVNRFVNQQSERNIKSPKTKPVDYDDLIRVTKLAVRNHVDLRRILLSKPRKIKNSTDTSYQWQNY